MSYLTVEGLTFAYRDQQVLTDIDLSIERGELVCVVGPNGSGKTTLLECLAGEATPERGSVSIGGTNIADLTVHDRASTRAYLSQGDRSDIPYTVETVVGFATEDGDMTLDERRTTIHASMRAVDVEDLASRPMTSLSGGERRRVAIARTLAASTSVLLMDEPTDSLDIGHADMVLARCVSEARSHRAVVISTHELNLASRHADTVILLSGGTIAAAGPPSEVLEKDRLSQIYACQVSVMPHPIDGGPIVFL